MGRAQENARLIASERQGTRSGSAADPVMSPLPSPPLKILVVGFDWDWLFQRPQQIATALARSNRVLYWCNTCFWGKRLLNAVQGRTRLPGGSLQQLGGNLTVRAVPKWIPARLVYWLPGLDFIFNWLRFRREVARLGIRRQGTRSGSAADPVMSPAGDGFDAAILALPSPSDALLWERVKARVKVVDCYDENVHFFPVGSRAARIVVRTEARVLQHAHLVLASSTQLYDRLARSHARVVMLPNGVDAEHFAPRGDTMPNRVPCQPDGIAGVKGPILGFVGALQSWIDFALIARVADELPEYTLVLIGPVECDVAVLQGKSNVILAGRRAYAELPGFLHRFDVCMIPFVDNELTRAVDPVKFYEYCAAGKPVVSTPLPTMQARSDIVYLASDPVEFARQVRRARAEDSVNLQRRRIDVARVNSWQARADTILREVALILKERQEAR
jgi:glycosyltransferase involved in cell wall biosynthesis